MKFKKVAAACLTGACLVGALGCGGGGGDKPKADNNAVAEGQGACYVCFFP